MSFLAGLMAAKALNSSFVLTHWSDGNVKVGVHRRPFQFFWDIEHLKEEAQHEGIKIITEFPELLKERCLAQFLSSESLELKIGKLKAGREVALCTTPQESFHQLWRLPLKATADSMLHGLSEHKVFHQNLLFEKYRKFLTPAPRFVSTSLHIVEQIRARFGIKEFSAVHVRLEQDFIDACHVWDRIDNLKCHIMEAELLHELKFTHGLPDKAPVYIASGLPSKSFVALCSTFVCIQKADVWRAGKLSSFGNSLALLDLVICSQAHQAFGNIYSTFSIELAAAMRSSGRHAAFYNTPCLSSSAECR